MVSIPRLKGVISSSKKSLLFPASISACTAAPRATTSSGLILSLTGFPKKAATASLTGTLTALPDVPCKAVTFLTACNVSANNGATIAIGPGLNFPCQNTNQLSVSGSGTLNYIILR